MTTESISVIIPALNMAEFLPDALASIGRQAVPVAEILVIDPGSTDGTAAVVSAAARSGLPVRRIETAPCGPGPARNCGLADAQGAIIAFLDADDLWPADKLGRQMARLAAAPSVDMVAGLVEYFDKLDVAAGVPARDARREVHCQGLLGACLFRRDIFEQIGVFDPSFRYAEDVDLLLRLREQAIPLTILRRVTLYYRRHPGSMMTQPDPRRQSDLRRALALSVARRRRRGLTSGLLPFDQLMEPEDD